MLLPDNIHPENSIYYNGAIVLQALQRFVKGELLDLYLEVKKLKNITFQVYVLCLDWLYLLDLAKINNKGEIELCS